MAPRDVTAPPKAPGPTTNHPSTADTVSGTSSATPQSSSSSSGFAAGNVAGFASTPPAVALPKGGGAVRGIDEKLEVNPSSGSCTLSIPITVSQARTTGGTPSLTLSYNSGAGNGPFGLGWGLTVASITRKTDKGLPRYLDAGNNSLDDEDVFVFSGVEDLVPRLLPNPPDDSPRVMDESVRGDYTVRRYLPRIEGSFFRIERCTNISDPRNVFWRVRTGDNQESIFGRDDDSRISDGQGRIYSWLLSHTNDRFGNAIEYSYQVEDSEDVAIDLAACERNRTNDTRARNRYLKSIKYGNQIPHTRDPITTAVTPGPWMFEVLFDYWKTVDPEAKVCPWTCRLDPFSTYRSGFEIRSYRLCHRIRMVHHFPNELGVGATGCLVHSTCLNYTESPVASVLTKVTTFGHFKTNGAYSSLPMPALSLCYTEPPKLEDLKVRDSEAPFDLAGDQYQWIDIDSEGLPGVLSEQAGGWFYRRNLSANNFVDSAAAPRFGPMELMKSRPAPSLYSPGTRLTDLDGTGNVDLVVLDENEGVRGFYERTTADGWNNFHLFSSWPNIDISQPNVQFVDLTGNGRADILVTEHEAFTWFPSLGKDGYAQARRTFQSVDEEKGPKLVFADGTQNIYLADFSGDGLHDLVRIRNGDICYWPSLGYGLFGEKVAMDNSPWFDHVDQFTHARLRLADIDGSGTTDLIYLPGAGGADIYFNFAGNGWSTQRRLQSFPKLDNISVVSTVDLLGNGCSCLVWTSPLSVRNHSLNYIDLTQSKKPFLLESYTNDMGLETRVSYAPSTRFYLDAQEHTPWSTRLPFPVHCVEMLEKFDRVSNSYSSTRYAYHDGFYDRVEREFRGFGIVEQWEDVGGSKWPPFCSATNIKDQYLVAPVRRKTWFHTGANIVSPPVPDHHSAADYFGPGPLLQGSLFPMGISDDYYSEALRSLKGRILREELYATESGDGHPVPFYINENNYTITMIQPGYANGHAVCLVTERESMTVNRERDPEDPRITHTLGLEHDTYGNLLRSISVAYGRKIPEQSDALTTSIQSQTHVVYSEREYTNDIDSNDDHVLPQLWQSREYHLTGVQPAEDLETFTFDQFQADECRNADEIPFEATATATLGIQKRLIASSHALYLKNDLTGKRDKGEIESLMLLGISYKLALTPGLIAAAYQGPNMPPTLANLTLLSHGGKYVELEGGWWIPSGQQGFGPLASSAPNLAAAREHFFTYKTFTDPFGQTTIIEYDEYDLLPVQITDPLDNTITIVNSYVHMQPKCITDMNGNRTEALQNPLGEVVGTAVCGSEGNAVGDSLEGFDWNVTALQLAAFLENPGGNIAEELLGAASTRTITLYRCPPQTIPPPKMEPSFRATIARETHTSDSVSPAPRSKLLITFTYFDGLGREIQVKTQDNQDVTPANGWHCSGWTVWNNRGLPVRQYEPFFDSSHEFVDGKMEGDSSVTCYYDYLGRPVCTFSPDGTRTKVIHDSWKTTTYDASDLLKLDPKDDEDVKYFYAGWIREYPDWETWYLARTKVGTLMTPLEKAAATRTEPHNNTPTVVHLDSLGREIAKVEDNGEPTVRVSGEDNVQRIFYNTRKQYDIVGNVCSVIDAQDRTIVSVVFDMTGKVLHNSTMDFGQEWILYDIDGKMLFRFQDQDIRIHTKYDILQRPTGHFHLSDSGTDLQFEKFVYGDEPGLDVPVMYNARGRIYKQYDQSGLVTMQYDFKGNVVGTERQLARKYKGDIDWSITDPTPPLENEIFITATTFDALNRPTEHSVDCSRTRNNYNSMSLISSVETWLSPPPTVAIPTPPSSWVPVITNTDYDAMGRKTYISSANNTRTEFTYDKQSLRLIRARTRTVDKKSARQDLQYTYDPRGNITHIDDPAQPKIDSQSASKDYTYDPINRLIKSSCRKNIGTNEAPHAVRCSEEYTYDGTGNIRLIKCRHDNKSDRDWTKKYNYTHTSPLQPDKLTNRLIEIEVSGKRESFDYDDHGNVVSMAGLPVMKWDFQNQLRETSRQVTKIKQPQTTYYVYGSDGNRVRKVTEREADVGKLPVRLYDTIYLGGFEIFRKYCCDGSTLSVQRKTTTTGGDTPIRRVETERRKTSDQDGDPSSTNDTSLCTHDPICEDAPPQTDKPLSGGVPLFRYQLPDHLGSVALELDNVGEVLSYEEYSAYGETTYQAPLSIPKPYRFSGKEQDTETGLYYFGARYYAASVGRWISPDPIGIGDGPNVYCYVRCNPVSFVDPNGMITGAPGSPDHTHWLATLPAQTSSRPPGWASNWPAGFHEILNAIPEITRWYHDVQGGFEGFPGVGQLYQRCGPLTDGAVLRPLRTVPATPGRPGRPGRPARDIAEHHSRFEIPGLENLAPNRVIIAMRHTYEFCSWRIASGCVYRDDTHFDHEGQMLMGFALLERLMNRFRTLAPPRDHIVDWDRSIVVLESGLQMAHRTRRNIQPIRATNLETLLGANSLIGQSSESHDDYQHLSIPAQRHLPIRGLTISSSLPR